MKNINTENSFYSLKRKNQCIPPIDFLKNSNYIFTKLSDQVLFHRKNGSAKLTEEDKKIKKKTFLLSSPRCSTKNVSKSISKKMVSNRTNRILDCNLILQKMIHRRCLTPSDFSQKPFDLQKLNENAARCANFISQLENNSIKLSLNQSQIITQRNRKNSVAIKKKKDFEKIEKIIFRRKSCHCNQCGSSSKLQKLSKLITFAEMKFLLFVRKNFKQNQNASDTEIPKIFKLLKSKDQKIRRNLLRILSKNDFDPKTAYYKDAESYFLTPTDSACLGDFNSMTGSPRKNKSVAKKYGRPSMLGNFQKKTILSKLNFISYLSNKIRPGRKCLQTMTSLHIQSNEEISNNLSFKSFPTLPIQTDIKEMPIKNNFVSNNIYCKIQKQKWFDDKTTRRLDTSDTKATPDKSDNCRDFKEEKLNFTFKNHKKFAFLMKEIHKTNETTKSGLKLKNKELGNLLSMRINTTLQNQKSDRLKDLTTNQSLLSFHSSPKNLHNQFKNSKNYKSPKQEI